MANILEKHYIDCSSTRSSIEIGENECSVFDGSASNKYKEFIRSSMNGYSSFPSSSGRIISVEID